MYLHRAVRSVAACSMCRLDRLERFGRGPFRITYLALTATLLRKISGLKYFVSDLLFWKIAARCVQCPSYVGAMQIALVSRITMKLSERPNQILFRSPP